MSENNEMAQLSIIRIPFLLCVQLLHNFFAPLLCKAGKEILLRVLVYREEEDERRKLFILYFFHSRRKLIACAKKALKFFQRRAKFNFTNRGNKVRSDDEGNHGLH